MVVEDHGGLQVAVGHRGTLRVSNPPPGEKRRAVARRDPPSEARQVDADARAAPGGRPRHAPSM